MRKNLTVGILRETKQQERRAPLTPQDAAWLIERKIKVEVESSGERIFSDEQYKKAGARIVNEAGEAAFLLGIKEPDPAGLKAGTITMVFSHTIKGQKENLPLLKACLNKKITLIDYERIVDTTGRRLVFFGKFAGICGAIDSLCYLGRKLDAKGVANPFSLLEPAYQYDSLSEVKEVLAKIAQQIRSKGLDKSLAPFVAGITGYGNVSDGVREILNAFKPVEVHPQDMIKFVRQNKNMDNKICMIVFDREEKLRSKDGKGFYFENYLQEPQKYESNLDVYLPHLNILFNTSYWDKKYPRLVTKAMVHALAQKASKLEFIGDIACDVNGSIEVTSKTTTAAQPVYTYDPKARRYSDGYEGPGISILARDNLPSELPKEASEAFSAQIREFVYQIAAHGITDVTEHVAIPRELRAAVITQAGKLTASYVYLQKYS